MMFSTPFLHFGIGFAGIPDYVACAERNDTLNGICRELTVCVNAGTTSADLVALRIPAAPTVQLESAEEGLLSFLQERCNVVVGTPLGLQEANLRAVGYQGEYGFGTQLISNDPLVWTTRGNDVEWADLCNWILHAIITAEALNKKFFFSSLPSGSRV